MQCDIKCAYTCYFSGSTVLGNGGVILVVILTKAMRSPTFTLIVCLAVSYLAIHSPCILRSKPIENIIYYYYKYLQHLLLLFQLSDFLMGSVHLTFVSVSWFRVRWEGGIGSNYSTSQRLDMLDWHRYTNVSLLS